MNRPLSPGTAPPAVPWLRRVEGGPRPVDTVDAVGAAGTEVRRRAARATPAAARTKPGAGAAAAEAPIAVATLAARTGGRFGPSTPYLAQAIAQAPARPEPGPDDRGVRLAHAAYSRTQGVNISFAGPHAPVDLRV